MADRMKFTVIGGGLGGYPAAIKAARSGASVTIIERDHLGGTCLNWGCIPTKSLLHAGEIVETIREAKTFGITCGSVAVDFKAVVHRKDTVVKQLRLGVEGLLKAKKIRIIRGSAELIDAATVRILETGETVTSDRILLATGSKPARIEFEGGGGPDVLDSDQVLQLTELPKSVVIIGGGVIGVEFAQIFKRLGAKVTIIELMDHLLPGSDLEIAQSLEMYIKEDGIGVYTGASVKKISRRKGGNTVTFTVADKPQKVVAEKIILAVGRKPAIAGLGLDRIGLAQEKGALVVNDRMETNISHIYAAGDATGGIMLAHVAAAEGEVAAANALGLSARMNYRVVPSCVYTSPEVASVGMTEEAARQKADVSVGRFPFFACGKALLLNRTRGMVKIISEKKYGEILGVHIIGAHATDMIAEAVLGMSMEMTVEELAHAMHPHPTLSETIMESALTLCGGAIHMP